MINMADHAFFLFNMFFPTDDFNTLVCILGPLFRASRLIKRTCHHPALEGGWCVHQKAVWPDEDLQAETLSVKVKAGSRCCGRPSLLDFYKTARLAPRRAHSFFSFTAANSNVSFSQTVRCSTLFFFHLCVCVCGYDFHDTMKLERIMEPLLSQES